MKREIVIAVVGVVALTCVLWLVRSEGREVRATIRDATDVTGHAQDAASKAGSLTGSVVQELKNMATGTGGRDPKAAVAAVGAVSSAAHDVAREVIRADLEANPITLREEALIGAKCHEEFVKQGVILDDDDLTAVLYRLADPLVRKCKRAGLSYRFFVCNSPTINAKSMPGGYVYVNKGILDMGIEPAELQFVLAHEIGHVDLGHGLKAIRAHLTPAENPQAIALNVLRGTLVQGLSRDDELEADAWAYNALRSLGQSKEVILRFPKRMADRTALMGVTDPQPRPPRNAVEAIVAESHQYFQSHPVWVERVQHIEGLS